MSVVGSYPCCDGALLLWDEPERQPAYFSEHCPHCDAVVWHRLSRIDPESWPETEFLALHVVDEQAGTVTPRADQPLR